MKKVYVISLMLLSWYGLCLGYPNPNDLPSKTIAHPAECGPRQSGSIPSGTLNQVFLKKITPSDLKCYPHEITEPGHYLVTRDFLHVTELAKDGEPLIRVLANNVTIDFQTFALYQEIPADQLDGTNPFVKSNLIEIGNGTNPISNIAILNGTLSGVAGIGILIKPEVSNVSIKKMSITNCLVGGIAISGKRVADNDLTTKNIEIESCWITDHGQFKIVGVVNGEFLDAALFPLAGSTTLGAFGVLAFNAVQIAIKDSEVSFCGAKDLDQDAIGMYFENCKDIEIVRSISSAHMSEDLLAKGMFFKNCEKGLIDCCVVSCNMGNGVVGIDLIDSDIFHISNTNIYDNSAKGDMFVNPPVIPPCPGPVTHRLFTRCTPCDEFVDSTIDVNLGTAYTDYKLGLTLPKTTPSCITNWQSSTDPADWTTFMDGFHAIDYTLEFHTHLSRAYGIRSFDSNYVTIDTVSVIDTTALNNSAWGIFIDRNICTTTPGALCNMVKFSRVLGTRAFVNSVAPNVTYNLEIEAFFGDILGPAAGFVVKEGETISMIGRAIGIEVRNCSECTVLHNNLIKANVSKYTFAAGLFLNRSTKSDVVGNRIECNCGFDLGYGILNRTVNPTDLTSSTTLFANGFSNATTTDKNINYGVFWSNGGIFSIKHAFTSDLGLLNNLGTHENIQIFFDAETQPNLPCMITQPDVDCDYRLCA